MDILNNPTFKNIISSKFTDYYDDTNILFRDPTILNHQYEHEALSYFPVDTGIEIECSVTEDWKPLLYNNITGIISNTSDTSEQRVRLKAGLDGLKGLYNVLKILNTKGILTNSGIHIHIDCSDFIPKFKALNIKNYPQILSLMENFILSELDTWGYKGTYNRRMVSWSSKGGWFCLRDYTNTFEIRIAPMTFSYSNLIKYIAHAHYIKKILVHILKSYQYLRYTNSINVSNEEIPDIFKKRVINITPVEINTVSLPSN